MDLFIASVDSTGMERKWRLIIDAASDLTQPLKDFGVYLRKKAKDKFEQQGPGWPALAKSTVERLEHTRTARVTSQGKLRKSSEAAIKRKLYREVKAGKASDLVFKELERTLRRSGGKESTAQHLISWALSSQRKSKTIARVEADLEKASKKTSRQRKRGQRKIAKHKLLGKLASSLRASVRKNELVVDSRVPWAGVHNKGGTAGHGARIPKRTFLHLDDDDVGVFIEILKTHLVKGIEG